MKDARDLLARFAAFGLLWLAVFLAAAGVQAREPLSTRGIETVRAVDLPPEARTTLRLIEVGGPFPYPRDGVIFYNRERLLPLKPRDYYREYTVPTPGARTRGARRIIAGRKSEFFYTDDHYRSFKRIVGND